MEKDKNLEIQKQLEGVFPIIASGSYVRPFDVSSFCWPLNWTYLGHKPKETIDWEYRSNSKKLPFFLYRENYSYTTIQASFSLGHANERISDLSSMYLDQDELEFNQSQFDAEMNETKDFRRDYAIVQNAVDEGDMLRNICKFDRKLHGALRDLNYFSEGKKPVRKVPIEKMFSPVRQFLAIPLIAESACAGNGLPSEVDITKYASGIWDKIEF